VTSLAVRVSNGNVHILYLRWIENGGAFWHALLHQRIIGLGFAGTVCRVLNLVVNIFASVHVKAGVEKRTVAQRF